MSGLGTENERREGVLNTQDKATLKCLVDETERWSEHRAQQNEWPECPSLGEDGFWTLRGRIQSPPEGRMSLPSLSECP